MNKSAEKVLQDVFNSDKYKTIVMPRNLEYEAIISAMEAYAVESIVA